MSTKTKFQLGDFVRWNGHEQYCDNLNGVIGVVIDKKEQLRGDQLITYYHIKWITDKKTSPNVIQSKININWCHELCLAIYKGNT